jgi:hypothetical protein
LSAEDRIYIKSEYKVSVSGVCHFLSLYIGNSEFIADHQEAFTDVLNDCTEPKPTVCNKDTGLKQRLQKWSRGHLFIVRGGGIIDKWSPLFK